MSCTPALTRSGALVIRTFDGDAGRRPIEPCDQFWLSPDLWLDGGLDRTTAEQGESITIVVRVTNGGTVPHEEISVEAWVCDYTAGPLPTGRLTPPGRMTGFAEGPLNPGQSMVIECAPVWVPTAEQVSMNAGHVCLAANVTAATPADGAELPSARPIVPCCDTHHAQRNIALVAGTAADGTLRQVMRFWGEPPRPEGPAPRPLDPVHILEELPVSLEIAPIQDRHGLALFPHELDVLVSNDVVQELPRWEVGDPASATFELEGDSVKQAQRAEFVATYDKPTIVAVNVTPPRSVKSGTILLYDAVTRHLETGELLGGARLMALVL